VIEEYVLEPGHWEGDKDPDGGGGFCLETSEKPTRFDNKTLNIMAATGKKYIEEFESDK
jgi:hypothetical protein